MAFSFPPLSSPAGRNMTPDVFEALARWRDLPTRLEASAKARRFCETTSGATGVYSLALLADDSVALCYFGIRGGFKQLWSFGKVE